MCFHFNALSRAVVAENCNDCDGDGDDDDGNLVYNSFFILGLAKVEFMFDKMTES